MAKQARVFTKEEAERALVFANSGDQAARNHLAMLLSFYAGLRSKEICSLKWGDVIDLDGSTREQIFLTAEQTKGKEAKTVYFSERIRGAIWRFYRDEAYKDEKRIHPDTAMIKSLRHNGPLLPRSLQEILKDIFMQAGFKNATSHSGRRSYITWLAEQGEHAKTIQELARHASLLTTQRYIDASPVKLSSAVNKL